MTLAEIALIVIAVALLTLVITFISVVITIKRTMVSVGALSCLVHEDLQPTIRELFSVLEELNNISSNVAGFSDDVRCFVAA